MQVPYDSRILGSGFADLGANMHVIAVEQSASAMSTAAPTHARPVAPTVRIPKLAIRQPSASDTSVIDCAQMASLPTATAARQDEASAFAARPLSQVSSPVLESSSSNRSLRSSRVSAEFDDVRNRSMARSTHSAKKGGVFAFLALKEPSAMALEQFAHGQKRSISHANGRSTPVGMSGVSSQRLPCSVPKVNSKWDGMPERPGDASSSSRGGRPQSRRLSSNLSDKTRRSSKTTSSKSHKRSISLSFGRSDKPVISTRSSAQSTVPSLSHPHSRDSSNTLLTPPESSAPVYPGLSMELIDVGNLAGAPVSRPTASKPDTAPLTPEFEGYDTTALHGLLDSPGSITVPPFSPATPPPENDIIPPSLLDLHFGDLETIEQHVPESPPLTYTTSPQKQPPSPPRQVSSRPAINFSRPRTQARGLMPMRLPPPTLSRSFHIIGRISEEPSSPPISAGDDDVAENSASEGADQIVASDIPHQTVDQHLPQQKILSSPAASAEVATARPQIPAYPFLSSDFAPCQDAFPTLDRQDSQESLAKSITPSVMSEQWHLSSKERLGMAGRIRIDEIAPWE